MSYENIRIAIAKIYKLYGIVIPEIKETIYRNGKMMFICENGERYWYSFSSDIVAKLA